MMRGRLVQLLIVINSLTGGGGAVGEPAAGPYRLVRRIDRVFSLGRVTGNLREYRHYSGTHLVEEYLGIPYAEPPVGELRFRYPVKKAVLTTHPSFNATRFGPACHQIIDTTFADEREGIRQASNMWNPKEEYGMSEDCLSLNVWVPHVPPGLQRKKSLPVMVWIYGGGFFSGTSNLDVYSGHRLAALEEVVVVSFNYRLGVLGFLYLDSLEAPGNMGLYDQVLALTWVRDHIASFGGDVDRVTLFGESAGSASIGFHLLSPLSHNLFTNAIMHSASPTSPWALMSRTEMFYRSVIVAEHMGCQYRAETELMMGCMRQKAVQQANVGMTSLFGHFPGKNVNRWLDFPVAPIVDGKLIPAEPAYLLAHGLFKRCPIMTGSNRNEGSYWLLYYPPHFSVRSSNLLDSAGFDRAMEAVYGFHSPPVLQAIKFLYRNWTNTQDREWNRLAIDKATGEENFACPCNQLAEHYSRANQRVYMYYLDHRSSTETWPEWMGAIHGADCEWVFGKFYDRANTPEEKQLVNRTMRYWANFARTGNPNRESKFFFEQELWPQWTYKRQLTTILNTSPYPQTGTGPSSKRCAFWNKLLPKMLATPPCGDRLQQPPLSREKYSSKQSPSQAIVCSLLPLILNIQLLI